MNLRTLLSSRCSPWSGLSGWGTLWVAPIRGGMSSFAFGGFPNPFHHDAVVAQTLRCPLCVASTFPNLQ